MYFLMLHFCIEISGASGRCQRDTYRTEIIHGLSAAECNEARRTMAQLYRGDRRTNRVTLAASSCHRGSTPRSP